MTAPASPEAGRLNLEALAEIEACGDVRASAACVPALIAEVRRLQSLLGRFAASAIASANNAQSIWLGQADWDELRQLAALAPVATGPGDARD